MMPSPHILTGRPGRSAHPTDQPTLPLPVPQMYAPAEPQNDRMLPGCKLNPEEPNPEDELVRVRGTKQAILPSGCKSPGLRNP